MPKFSYVQVNQHLKDCRKKDIGEKGYKYFVEDYIHNMYVSRTSSAVSTVKARCYRSQRKSEEPHTLQICVLSSNGEANIAFILQSSQAIENCLNAFDQSHFYSESVLVV